MKSLKEFIFEGCVDDALVKLREKLKACGEGKSCGESSPCEDSPCEDGPCGENAPCGESSPCEDEDGCPYEDVFLDEGEVKDEDDFREYAENKFKEVFGDKLDKDRMKRTIDGLLKDNKKLVDAGEWGELVGMLNKSFGS